jgi:anti-sigma factor RsiW
MTEHVTPWLEAYYDGEIKGRRARQIENHLETCAACQVEFESLNSLSALLQEFPEARNLTPVGTFTAQVGLRLPRKTQECKSKSFLRAGWQWAPVGLLATWLFIQTVFLVSGVISWMLRVIPGANQFADILPSGTQTETLLGNGTTLADAGFGEIGQFWLNLLQGGGPLGWAVTLNFVLTLLLGLMYLSWLASWWVQKSNGNKPS